MSYIPSTFADGSLTITDDGGHSATITLSDGSQSISGIIPSGREQIDVQSRGAWVGSRLGQRVFPTITVSGTLTTPSDAFNLLATGLTVGFVNTAASLGDVPHVDGSWSFGYGAEARAVTFDDASLTDLSFTEGAPSTYSITLTVKGPMEIDAKAIIPSR